MTVQVEEKYLQGARQIASDLLRMAERDEDGLFWKTMHLDENMAGAWSVSEGLYSGCAGIVMLFADLFAITGEAAYLETADQGVSWLIAQARKQPALSFAGFTGRLSLVFPMVRLFELTAENRYREGALTIAADSWHTGSIPGEYSDDLLNGNAGTLLVYLYLHAAFGETWLLEPIDKLAARAIESAHTGPRGLYWDRSGQQIRGLCGFSHGSAGVGFALIEMGRYFQNPTYLAAARQAFDYETYWFERYGYWPDFRRGVFSPKEQIEHDEALAKGDMAFFTEPKNMGAWCHGAPGITFSRLRAWQVTGQTHYRDELRALADATLAQETQVDAAGMARGFYILCHGTGGNRVPLIDAYLALEKPEYLACARALGDEILGVLARGDTFLAGYPGSKESDTSLFMGNAGIAYYLLKLAAPGGVTPILAPTLTTQFKDHPRRELDWGNYPNITLDMVGFWLKILAKSFPRTIELLQAHRPAELKGFLAGLGVEQEARARFERWVGDLTRNWDDPRGAIFQDLIRLESTRLAVDLGISSASYLAALLRDHFQRHEKVRDLFSGEELPDLELVLGHQVQMITCAYNWAEAPTATQVNPEPEETTLVLQPLPKSTAEQGLNDFSRMVLECFQEAKTVKAAFVEIKETFELESEDEARRLQGMVQRQILEALDSAILNFA